MFRDRVKSKYVLADYEQYRGKTWVHFTDHEQLKFNYSPFHHDPIGIYFFPEGFKTKGSWHAKPYKYTAKLKPDAKVFDLATIKTHEDAVEFLKKMKVEKWDAESTKKQWSTPSRAAWHAFTDFYSTQKAKMNSLLRAAGYDAVFDDTDSIFSGENQLIVLDPKMLTDVKQTRQGETGYKEVAKARDIIIETLKEFDGKVILAARPKKTRGFGNDPAYVGAKIHFAHDESTHTYEAHDGTTQSYPIYGREIRFEISTHTDSMGKKKRPATSIRIRAEGKSDAYSKAWPDRREYRPSSLDWRLEEFNANDIAPWVRKSMKMMWDDTEPARDKAEWDAYLKAQEEKRAQEKQKGAA